MSALLTESVCVFCFFRLEDFGIEQILRSIPSTSDRALLEGQPAQLYEQQRFLDHQVSSSGEYSKVEFAQDSKSVWMKREIKIKNFMNDLEKERLSTLVILDKLPHVIPLKYVSFDVTGFMKLNPECWLYVWILKANRNTSKQDR